MKKGLVLLSMLLFVSPIFVSAQMMGGEAPTTTSNQDQPCSLNDGTSCDTSKTQTSQSLEQATNQLLQKYQVSNLSQLDCSKVSNEEFAQIGDALMSYMHPDEQQHAALDQAMGGEGSSQLESMHVFMGQRYLGCGAGAYGPMMMSGNQWTGSYPGHGMMGFNGMMGDDWGYHHAYGFGSFWPFGLVCFFIVGFAIWGLVALIWLLVQRNAAKSRK